MPLTSHTSTSEHFRYTEILINTQQIIIGTKIERGQYFAFPIIFYTISHFGEGILLFEGLNKARARFRHVVDGEIAVAVLNSAVCTALEQQASDRWLIPSRSIEKNSFSFLVGEIYVSAFVKQLLHNQDISTIDSQVEWRLRNWE